MKNRGYLDKYSENMKQILDVFLEKYISEGIYNLKNTKILELEGFKEFGSATKIVKMFGGKKTYLSILSELEKEIYL